MWHRKIWFNPPFLWKCLYQVRAIAVCRLLTDFVSLLIYELCLSLWKIARCSVILLLPLFDDIYMLLKIVNFLSIWAMTGTNSVTMKIALSGVFIDNVRHLFSSWRWNVSNFSIFCEVGSIISRSYVKIGWMKVLIKYNDVIGSNPFWPCRPVDIKL